jgi:hypothetical protein
LPEHLARRRRFSLLGKGLQEITLMLIKTAASLAFAATCLTALATMPAQAQMAGSPPPAYSGPQTYQGDMPSSSAPTGETEIITNGPQGSPPGNWSARRNVIESQRYDRLLETNRAFREARMRKECGPITDQDLHQQCLASFQQDTPYMGSSAPRRPSRSEYGR